MTFRALLVLLLAAYIVLPEITTMQPAAAQKAAAPSSANQVNGIVDGVVDLLWEQTDHYWHDGDYNRIIDLCRICVEADPTFDEAYGVMAWLLWSQGNTPAADWVLEYGVKRSPKQGAIYFEYGWQLYNTKRFDAALPYLEKAVARGKVPLAAYTTLAHCYTKLNRLKEAVDAWKVVVKRFPNFGAGKVNLKRAEERLAAAGGKS